MVSLRPLTQDDFPLLLAWLAKPHVKQWWDDGDDTLEKVAAHYGAQSAMKERFILIYHHAGTETPGQPIGYLQYEVEQEEIAQDEIGQERTASIDQFIGKETMLNRGISTEAIKLLLAYLLRHHQTVTVTVDPAPTNKRAIRCYEKVGFRHDASLPSAGNTPAYMMKIDY